MKVNLQTTDVLSRLRAGGIVDEPVCFVAAHPDDETISAGARLGDLRHLTLVHITDGVPEDGDEARQKDLAWHRDYRDRRHGELQDALDCLGIRARQLELGIRDQSAAFHLAQITKWLLDELSRAEIVITHPYEGGHPDHDSAAFAVQAACRLLMQAGRHAPVRLEFASYHLHQGRRVTGAFRNEQVMPAVQAQVSADRFERKKAALSCFRSQQAVIAWFAPGVERYRAAPSYDFTAPPAAALYDLWHWPIDSRLWQAQAASALVELGLLRK